MVDRQLPHPRLATQTRRQAAPSPLSRLLALPAGDGAPCLGLARPRGHANYRPTISREPWVPSSYPGRAPSVVGGSKAVRTTLARARLLRGT